MSSLHNITMAICVDGRQRISITCQQTVSCRVVPRQNFIRVEVAAASNLSDRHRAFLAHTCFSGTDRAIIAELQARRVVSAGALGLLVILYFAQTRVDRRSRSSCKIISMMEAAEPWNRDDVSARPSAFRHLAANRRLLAEAKVGPVFVVIADELIHEAL